MRYNMTKSKNQHHQTFMYFPRITVYLVINTRQQSHLQINPHHETRVAVTGEINTDQIEDQTDTGIETAAGIEIGGTGTEIIAAVIEIETG